MGYKTDIEIAQECEMKPITEIAAKAGIDDKYLEQYGKYKAKIDYNLLKESDKKDGKLILVTAINPTPAGEGKTTTTVGLADGMQRMGKNVMVALREPSLGPVFGVKGGAAGGGYAQVVPMEYSNQMWIRDRFMQFTYSSLLIGSPATVGSKRLAHLYMTTPPAIPATAITAMTAPIFISCFFRFFIICLLYTSSCLCHV